MKQNILIKEIEILDQEGKTKLLEWWKPKPGDLVFLPDAWIDSPGKPVVGHLIQKRYGGLGIAINEERWGNSEGALPLLSIGQMIQFLNDHSNEQALGFDDSGVFWRVIIGGRGVGAMMEDRGSEYMGDDGELTTPLWEACVSILNK